MKSFVIYNSDGEILRAGVCVDTDFGIQAREGEFILEASCKDTRNHKVVDGKLVYSPKQDTVEEVLAKIRKRRNALLNACDFTQVSDYPASDKAEWATYRQALRDLPSQYQNETDFANVVFPNSPE